MPDSVNWSGRDVLATGSSLAHAGDGLPVRSPSRSLTRSIVPLLDAAQIMACARRRTLVERDHAAMVATTRETLHAAEADERAPDRRANDPSKHEGKAPGRLDDAAACRDAVTSISSMTACDRYVLSGRGDDQPQCDKDPLRALFLNVPYRSKDQRYVSVIHLAPGRTGLCTSCCASTRILLEQSVERRWCWRSSASYVHHCPAARLKGLARHLFRPDQWSTIISTGCG